MANKTILLVDDEKEIVELLKLFLEKENYAIIQAHDGKEAWRTIQTEKVDLALIDIMMPELDGYTLIKKIRSEYKFPVIMLSAKCEDADKILGLGLGADDFISKPFNPLEVVARVSAMMRRTYEFAADNNGSGRSGRTTVYGDMLLDHDECMVYRGQTQIMLTYLEYKLLSFLMTRPGRIYTKRQIFENVWSEDYFGDDNTIMVHISKLRDKIEPDPRNPQYIKTIRGLGYKLEKRLDSLEKN